MTTPFPTQRLLTTLAVSSFAFLLSGLFIQRFTTQKLTVIIDRSYCPTSQWQGLAQDYTHLYQQHQRKQTRIQSVILFSDLSQTQLDTPPPPSTIQSLKTYGQVNLEKQQTLQQQYPKAKVLSCQLLPGE